MPKTKPQIQKSFELWKKTLIANYGHVTFKRVVKKTTYKGKMCTIRMLRAIDKRGKEVGDYYLNEKGLNGFGV